MMKEEVFEAAKALEPEEEGCSFYFIVLDISVECISIVETVHPALVKTSVNLRPTYTGRLPADLSPATQMNTGENPVN